MGAVRPPGHRLARHTRMRVFLPVIAALTVAGCAVPASHPAPARTVTVTAAAVPGPSYRAGDRAACRAFREATVTGVPPSAQGETTMTWLRNQADDASPALQAAVTRLADAWGDPSDPTGINRAQDAVRRLCRH